MADRVRLYNPEVPCRICRYHYRVRPTMTATDHGWECADRARCNHNVATRAKFRRQR